MDALDCDTSLANASAVFNYSKSMMAIYHSKGFHIYHQEKSLYQRITPFGINHFSFVFDTNVFVLVPNQRKGKYNVSTIVIWDEDAGQEMHIRDTHKPIHHIAHVKEYIAVASLDRIALYNLNKDGPLRYISIGVRQPALAGSLNYHTFLVVFPYAGNVACVSFASPMGGPFPLRSTQQCDPIDQIAVSYSGEYVACSYRKLSGTSRKEIKIYSTVQKAELYSIIVHEGKKQIIKAFHFDRSDTYFIYFVVFANGGNRLLIAQQGSLQSDLTFNNMVSLQLEIDKPQHMKKQITAL